MGRIRTVKPDLFKHDDLFEAEAETGLPLRVAFIGLFTVCDREGRFKWKPRRLKIDVLPFDELDFSRVLDALSRANFIKYYRVHGEEYGYIPSFARHQVINNKEVKSTIPPSPEEEPINHLYSGINVPAPVFKKISERDGGRCLKCSSTEDLTVDHVIPQSVEFNNSFENLRILCRSCNSSRSVNGEPLKNDILEWYENSEILESIKCRLWPDDYLVSTRDHASTTRLYFPQGERKGREGKGREGVVSNDTCPADAEPVVEKANHAEKINAVFVHWQTVLNHPQAKLDEKRKRFIRNALKSGYDVDQLKQAVDGCSRTPHNMGDNDRHQVYDGIHIIFKDADQIDRFIRNSGNQLVSNMSRAGRSAQAAGDALMAEMFGDSDGH